MAGCVAVCTGYPFSKEESHCMNSIAIYYFSGTGNTEIVAGLIKDGMVNLGCEISMFRIEDSWREHKHIDLSNYDMMGIGCPVIGFGIPDIVRKFLRLLPESNGRKVFIFRTAGGVSQINYNASRPLIKELTKRGYDVFHERIFAISSNWSVRFEDEVVRQLYEATVRKTAFFCKEVLDGKVRRLNTGKKLRIKMGLVQLISTRILRLAGKNLAVNNSCSGCGTCACNCPTGNIINKKGKIKFGFSCTNCMRCIYACPNGAIYYRHFQFITIKGGYNIRKILDQPLISHVIDENTVPPFFKKYINEDNI